MLALGCCFTLVACGGEAPADTRADNAAVAPAPAAADEYFSFVIDGRRIEIDRDDVLTSFWPDGTFKVYAGADGSVSLALTVPNAAACPCTVAAGSIEPGDPISQGSVSLQNFPEPGNTLNNWYLGLDGTPPSAAVSIVDIGHVEAGIRYITGTFNTTVLKTESNGDGPGNRDYAISEGRFRVRHQLDGADGF